LSREFLSGIAVTLELKRDAPTVNVGRGPLQQILLNLLLNAAEAMQGKGRLKIAVSVRPTVQPRPYILRPPPSQQYVELSVVDSGPGIAPEIRDRLLEPFFTTKRSGSKAGTGLGLRSMSYRAHLIGASLEIKPGEREGAVVTCSLPVA